MDIEKKLSHLEFLNREYNVSHLDYHRENAFFNAIKNGDTAEAERLFSPIDDKVMGRLSDDDVRNLKYHLIITIALITRACIEGGMEMETAYNLSDIYIRSIDKSMKMDQLNMLHSELVRDYAQRMHIIRRTNRYPRAVTLCLDYIYDNLHTRITLDELASQVGLSPSYLSRLFSSEVGMTVSEYITRKRIEAASNMLKYSDFSVLDIAEHLCFSSESHFIKVFRERVGMTPRVYREEFFRVKK
ncbi:MAG: AraC family transcriptional regulator [Ruminococcus sp.]|nr:AraC family transcriptional regulator [Ruminococcus sp.]